MQRKLKGAFALFLALIVIDSVLEFVRKAWLFQDRVQPGYESLEFVSPSAWMMVFSPLVVTVAVVVMLRGLNVARREDDCPSPASTAISSFSAGLGSLTASNLTRLLLDYPALFSYDMPWHGILIAFGSLSLSSALSVTLTLLYFLVFNDYAHHIIEESDNPRAMFRSKVLTIVLPVLALWISLVGTLVLYSYFDNTFNWFAIAPIYVAASALVWVAQKHFFSYRDQWVRSKKALDEHIEERVQREEDENAREEVQAERSGGSVEAEKNLSVRELTAKWLGMNGETEDNPGDTGRLLKRWAELWPGWLVALSILAFIFYRDTMTNHLWALTYNLEVDDSATLLSIPTLDWWFDDGLPNLALAILALALSWVSFNRWMFGKPVDSGDEAELDLENSQAAGAQRE